MTCSPSRSKQRKKEKEKASDEGNEDGADKVEVEHDASSYIDDKETKPMKIGPPFINTYKSQTLDRSKYDYATTWSINNAFFIPPVMHYLSADINNTNTDATVNDPKVKEQALYAARYHANNIGSTNVKCHGAMDGLYDTLNHTEFTCSGPNDIIGAAVAMSNIFNVMLIDPQEVSPNALSKEDRHKKLREQGEWFATMFCTICSRSGFISAKDFISNMCELKLLCNTLYPVINSCISLHGSK